MERVGTPRVMMTLGLAVGLGRNGFESRYITLSVPILCCVYLIFVTYLPRPASDRISVLLLAAAVLAFWPSMRSGMQYGRTLRAELGSFEEQMKDGVPPYLLIHEFQPYLHPHEERLSDYLPMLRTARFGAFGFLKENPAFEEIAVPLRPAALEYADWEEPTAHTRSPFAEITVWVCDRVAGIRIQPDYKPCEFRISQLALLLPQYGN